MTTPTIKKLSVADLQKLLKQQEEAEAALAQKQKVEENFVAQLVGAEVHPRISTRMSKEGKLSVVLTYQLADVKDAETQSELKRRARHYLAAKPAPVASADSAETNQAVAEQEPQSE